MNCFDCFFNSFNTFKIVPAREKRCSTVDSLSPETVIFSQSVENYSCARRSTNTLKSDIRDFNEFYRNRKPTFLILWKYHKIVLLMFPWQHIFESILMRNQPIQFSNDVTVTLFLHQSSQNFEVCLDIIISTSVQNCSRIQCFIFPWRHIL